MINTTVNYTSSVTIRTIGDVLIDNGSVFTSNSSITIVSGGDVILINNGEINTSDSPGASGSITLEAAGSINLQRGYVWSGDGGETSGEVILKAFGNSSISLDRSYVWSGNAGSDSGKVELWTGGSIGFDASSVWSGNSVNGATGHLFLYALGSSSVDIYDSSVWSGNAGSDSDSGNVELWTGGSIDFDASSVWSGNSVNGATGHLFLYALGSDFSSLSSSVWTGNGPMGTGDFSILATGPVTSIDSSLWTGGNVGQGDSGGLSLTSVVGHTTVNDSSVWTGNAFGTSGGILIQDFAPPPEGGEISVVSWSSIWTGNAGAVSGDITFLTGFNPCRAVQAPTLVPTLTPIGLIALVGLLSVIVAMSIKIRKRRG